ncbi:bifunctional lysylphosphatidylglycerol flippase/synthetase MprF [Actinomycetospora rhizophila]|uniref:Bifunctional lysylphosphatidylglycerol flippase/synthetase MprF n=1 Tax=Actinomycetospora rhizophila TaxID=1416876 RepID=A0ABV9ZG57_9PSEU
MTATAPPEPTDPVDQELTESTGDEAGDERLAAVRARAAGIARWRPVTTVTTLLMLVGGIATGAFWTPLAERSWASAVATGVPALAEGHWWTPLSAALVGAHPVGALLGLLLAVVGLGWAEGRLGSGRTAVVLVVAQLAAVLVALGIVVALAATGWVWAVGLAGALTGGLSTGVLAVLAVASATLGAPWRLRLRLALVGVALVGLLFLGHLADTAHTLALAVALPLGHRIAGAGAAPSGRPGRREWRLVAAAGLVAIAVIRVLTLLVPVAGPLGDTASDSTPVETLVSVVISLLLAAGLRRGRRLAWLAGLVLGGFYLLVGLFVIGVVIWAQLTGQMDQVELVGLAVFVPNAVLWSALLVWLVAGRHAFAVPSRRRLRRRGGGAATGPEVARDALHRHGGSTLSWMTTWPENRYLEHADGVTAYRVHAGVAVALGDPIVAPADRTAALEDFRALAERSGWVPCLFSTTEALADAARADGWRSLQVAEDTLIDLEGLEFKGKPWQNVRSAFNRAGKAGISHRMVHLAEEPRAIVAQVRAISEEWVGDKGLPEMGFTLGGVEEALDPEVRTGLAVDAEGTVHGVTSWLPVYGPDDVVVGWTLDVMRRRQEGFRAVVEYLIASACLTFQAEGARFLSLSGAPLARAGDEVEGEHVLDRVLDRMGELLEPYYGFRSLHTFKAKFQPRYAPMFLVYRDEADLPRVGIGIGRAYLPDARVRDLVALVRS